jgi:hypothetical protein
MANLRPLIAADWRVSRVTIRRFYSPPGLSAAVSAALLYAFSNSVIAAAVVPCSTGTCAWSLAVGGSTVESGTYSIDPSTGLVSSGGTVNWNAGGDKAGITLSGNSDPLLGFNFSAGTTTAASVFSLTLTMPIALSGSIAADSSVSYSLQSNSSAGAFVQPTAGHVVTAFEESSVTGGPPPLNKGVDVGDAFDFAGGPAVNNSPVYTAANLFNLAAGNQYDMMTVVLSFTLSANSNVGLSGFVEQTPVPLPAGVWLLLTGGLAIFGLYGRRQIQTGLFVR